MIHVLITVKPSYRFPGKNARLAGYTVAWLAMELLHMEEPARVYTVGTRAELPQHLPPCWQHIECATGSHRGDIELAEAQIAPAPGDVMVLAQLTQPLRRPRLLAEVATLARRKGSAVTCCRGRREDWRALRPDPPGSWSPDKGGHALLHDGALYAWQPGQVAAIFTATAPHGVAVNYSGAVVDVDTPDDVPPGLNATWAAILLGDYLCPHAPAPYN